MNISSGVIKKAQKIVIYGPEGIGKSTFASQFPAPVFIDTEGSTYYMNVSRMDKPLSFTQLINQVNFITRQAPSSPDVCRTLIIDTADWAEILCVNELLSETQKKGIEDFGYGKGYIYLSEKFGKLLNALTELCDAGVNVVLTAHAQMRKFEQPDEMGSYDRWELKLSKKCAPLVKEWADMVLFANYKTTVINVDNQGALKGKNKVQGGKRVMYAAHHPCWDAKNRHGLPDELPFEFNAIAHCIPGTISDTPEKIVSAEPEKQEKPLSTDKSLDKVTKPEESAPEPNKIEPPELDAPTDYTGIPPALIALMEPEKVTPEEIKKVVAARGYYPSDTPIANYSPDFINGCLIGAWAQVMDIVKEIRENGGKPLPF